MKRDAIDLGTVKVFTLFKKYFIPTLFGMLSMSAVTAMDGIFVGHGIGSDGIAAINICIPLLMLFTGVGLMVGAGSSVVASIQLSRGKPKAARINVTQAILFVTVVALIPSALMMAYPSATARLLMGAAFAATIGLFAGGLIGLVYLFRFARKLRFYPIKWSVKSMRLSFRNLGYQCRIGSSALLTEATLATLMFVGNQVFMKYLGDDGVGAFGIVCYYIPFVFMVGNAIAQSAQPIISYNFGLGYQSRVVATERIALLTSVACGVIIMTAFCLFPHILVGLFISPDNPAARLAIAGYPYFSAAFIFFILNLTVIGYYQSVERVKPATVLALLRGFVFLIPSFILLPQAIGTNGIWLALCLSEMLTTVVIVVMYSRAARKACLPQRTE